MKTSFWLGINTKIVGKTHPDKLSYPGAFNPAELTLEGLATHISKGHPWMPAVLDEGQRRQQQYANYTEVFALDIDGDLTIAQALEHPFIQAHCALAIESASSTPEHNKYRLCFIAQKPIGEKGDRGLQGIRQEASKSGSSQKSAYSDRVGLLREPTNEGIIREGKLLQELERSVGSDRGVQSTQENQPGSGVQPWRRIAAGNRFLANQVGFADPACKDASRFFFGAPGRSPFILNESAVLPADFAEQATAWHEGQERDRQQRVEEARARYESWRLANPIGTQDTDALVDEALACIPSRRAGEGTFEMFRDILWALKSHYGEDAAVSMMEQHSPDGWNIQQVARGPADNYSLGTLFYFAKQYGFRFPDRPQQQDGRKPGEITAQEWRGKGFKFEPSAQELHDAEDLRGGAIDRLTRQFNWLANLSTQKKKKRARVESIAAEDAKLPYIPGCIPLFSERKGLLFYVLERSDDQITFTIEAAAKGWVNLANLSDPGVGKSHTAGLLRPEMFQEIVRRSSDGEIITVQCEQPTLFYLSHQARLPSTVTVEANFSEVTVRHDGMVVDGGKNRGSSPRNCRDL